MADMNDTTEADATKADGTVKPAKSKLGCILGLFILLACLLPLWFFLIGPNLRHDRLVEKGVRAPGRLLDVKETGNLVNNSPELKLTVEFRRSDGVLDTSTTRFVPSLLSLSMFQSGVAVTAAYDAEDPDEITVIDISNAPPTASSPSPSLAPAGSPTAGARARSAVADSLRRLTDSLRIIMEEMKTKVEHLKKKNSELKIQN